MMLPPEPTPEDIQRLAERVTPAIKPLLAGQHPAAQGGALADLVATWLAGHCFEGDLAATRQMRQQLLSDFILYVERFLPICAEELGTPHDPIQIPTDDEHPFRRQ